MYATCHRRLSRQDRERGGCGRRRRRFTDGAILHIEAEDPEQPNAPHKDKWLTKMSTFLRTGLPPLRMRIDEKKRLAVRSRNFCLIQGTLYHKGSDGIGTYASAMTKRKQSYGKHTAESHLATTSTMQRRAKYAKQAYGGQPHNETLKSTIESATCATD